MKTLFNKEYPKAGEILDIIGFTDADIALSKLWPYLNTASREIYNIIGKTNYQICEAVFEDEHTASEENYRI